MQKQYFILISLFLLSVALQAQQDEQYTQYMYHKMGFNPAYAGAVETPTFTVLAREQWLGLNGAPSTQLINFNMPLSSTGIGLGATISRHSIGLTERFTAEASYAYRFNLGVGGRLGIGISSSVRLLRMNFNEAQTIQDISVDNAVEGSLQSKYVPNFGAGIYFSNQTFYLGFSIPRLLENNIDFADDATIASREVRHFYLTGGVLINLSETVQLQPQALLKYLNGAPFDGEMNLNFIFNQRLTTGISYRIGGSRQSGLGESFAALLGIQVNDHLLFGLSYDATVSDLRAYNSGSLEGIVRYALGGRSAPGDVISPRFF